MWRCPKCGVGLVSRNLSHACGAFSVRAFLKGKRAHGRKLFARFVEAIAAGGPYELAPAKTRVAFMTSVRFASVNRVGADAIDVHFVLPRKVTSARLRRVEKIDRVYVHHLRLAALKDFDAELEQWLRASREEYGDRGWLKR
jgi:hypothetical protein